MQKPLKFIAALQTHTNKLKPNKGRKLEAWEKFLIQIICVSREKSPFIPFRAINIRNISIELGEFSTGGVLYIFFLFISYSDDDDVQGEMNILFEIFNEKGEREEKNPFDFHLTLIRSWSKIGRDEREKFKRNLESWVEVWNGWKWNLTKNSSNPF